MSNTEYLKKQVSIMINLFQTKRFDSVIDKGKILIKKFPDQAIFHNITSLACMAIDKNFEAKKILLKILEEKPMNITILNNLGLASVKCGDNDEAKGYYDKALKIKPDFLDALVNLGNLKLKINKSEQAKELFVKAIKIDKQIIPAKISLAGYYEQLGSFEKAKEIYREIIKDEPNYTIADKSFSLIHKYKQNDEHIKIMEEKLSKNINDEGTKWLSFALGKAYEDIGNYKKSFNFYENGNMIYKKTTKYELKNDVSYFEKIKKIFKYNKINPIDDYGQKIIFILGMPRSGTTLTEQILSSHKDVYGGGELSFLKEGIEKKLFSENEDLTLSAEELKPEILNDIKDYYLKKIEIYKNEKKYLVDKAPLNFKWIGFIMAIFPNSKIIHCTRDPMAICWSNYKNTFSSKSMNYTYDFNDLAGFYKAYDDLMKFWIKKFDSKIFNMSYENLVGNKESETRRILKFCDLEWDNNCLKFHENKRSVSTASLAQVRQPLYSSSLKKWKNYSESLEILNKQLIN